MARTRVDALLLLFLILIQQSPVSESTAILRHDKSMLLPLFLSPPKNHSSTRRVPAHALIHRHLQGSVPPNARMRLYDDLLLNGYYTTRLWIGTPPQRFALIVDTGSTVTYVPCSTCDHCGLHQDPRFQPDLSSTYHPVKCNIKCTCDDAGVQCIYKRQYAEMSTTSGVLGEDKISFGDLSELAPQVAVFGCENVETGDLYSQRADGIMGLGRGDLSIVDQLVEKGVISDSFSLCYGGMDVGGGAMVLGGISPPSDMVFTHSDPVRSPYYNIDLKEIHVAGKPLHLSRNVFDGRYGTILDSGTTYAYLPEAAFAAFKDAIMKELHALKQIQGPDPNFNDICFSGAGSDVSQLPSTFPVVDMVFGNGQKLSLSPENYLFQHSKVRGAYCLGVFQNGNDPTTLLGGIIVRNTLTMYDRGNSKIGFLKTNCSNLWERLHMTGTPPPVPSSPVIQNSTVDSPPMPAPSAHSDYAIPDKLKIGQITFEMSLNVNYTALKPHFAELTGFIAHELGINTSQVHLMNVTSEENTSFITFTILPSGSVDYISNATALSIIARIAEHQMRLPESLGTYQLINWKVEPPTNRTWWQQHHMWVVFAGVIILVLSLSASGLWFIWRWRRQNQNLYKPVNEAVPEQELQPI